MGYIATLFLALLPNYCDSQRIDGTPYSEFIKESQDGYRNEPAWSLEVKRGQDRICGQVTR